MCNDFERQIEWKAFCDAMDAARLGMAADAAPSQLPEAADVRVGDMAPVLRAKGNVVTLEALKWGFPPAQPKSAPGFNFRSEGRRFAKATRCLIPASAFFEFTGKQTPKSKWRFELIDRPFFAVAGLWRAGAGDSPGAFSMLTTSPGPDIAPFHDRQVVVLPVEDWAGWLYFEGGELELLRPLPANSLTVSLDRLGKDKPDPSLLRQIAG